jgi:FAD/FMN-containing dehydrogenase
MSLTVRGGGHNVAGLAVRDDAIMLDLSPMRAVHVQPESQLAHAQGGCLLCDLDRATAPHGLACPVGIVGDTGLGGLALGGGYGWLARRWGLTCDHIAAAEVVLANGSVVEASQEQFPELLWGLRGGGGNFGVVTRFTMRLRPVGDVWHQTASYALDRAKLALNTYNEAAVSFPDGLQVAGTFKRVGPEAMLLFTAVHLDGLAGRKVVDAFFSTTGGVTQQGTLLRYQSLQAGGDGVEPAGRRYYTKSCYPKELNGAAIDALLDAASRLPSQESVIDVNRLGGAIGCVPEASSAFPARDARFICAASAAWRSPTLDAHAISWSRSLIAALGPVSDQKTYVNYTPLDDDSVVSLYGEHRYKRLLALKNLADPDNLFDFNHNVRPRQRIEA